MNQFLASGGQSVGVSVSASVLPMNIQELIFFRIDWFDLLSVQGTPKSLLPTPQFKSINSSVLSFLIVQLSHPYIFSSVQSLSRV